MDEPSTQVTCSRCGKVLNESTSIPEDERVPCSECGSTARTVHVTAHDTITVHTKLNLKGRRPGWKKPFIEQTQGDDLHRKSGKWMNLVRIIDRANNRYKEKVTDPETSDTVHESEELLSDHQGHGSAKHKRNQV